jgi:tripartite ATP-independent transporter DctP family solute receptor
MKSKLLSSIFLVASLALLVSGCSSKANIYDKDGKVHLRMAQASAANGAIGMSMEAFAKDVNEKSNGRISVSVFHNGQLGSERDNIEACELGNLDIAVVNQSVLANFIPEIAAFDLPYTIQSAKHADQVFLGPLGQDFLQRLEKVRLHGLGVWESGFRNLTNSKRKINSVEDVAGLRIRVMENKIHQDLWKALGADPVPMSWSEAYTGMQQGAIDGQENPATVIDKNNVVEVNKNMAITEHVYSTVFLIMAPKTWNNLKPEDQKIITDCMAKANKSERELSRKMDKEAITTLESKGMVVTHPDKKKFFEMSQSVRDKYGASFRETLEQIEAANK